MSTVRLQSEPIDLRPLLARVRGDADGAVAVFLGTVRDHHAGRRVIRLEYHAYAEMARPEMERIARRAERRFAVSRVALVHRTGSLEIGETSVAVVVSAPHRADAFAACRWVIDEVKRTVPIWKKEFYEGGEAWLEGGSRAARGEAGHET